MAGARPFAHHIPSMGYSEEYELQTQCGICGFEIEGGKDNCVPLKKSSKTPPILLNPSYTLPVNRHHRVWNAARWFNIQSRSERYGPKLMIAHADCFKLFLKECTCEDRLERLFTLGNWVQPWATVLTLYLDPSTDVTRGISLVADVYNMPGIKSMPLEVANLIQEYSRSHIIWRFASALDRLDKLTKAGVDQLDLVPLRQVALWERGSLPTLSSNLRGEAIRLAIDSYGLAKIERMALRPKSTTFSSKTSAYVVEHQKDCKQITVDFKFGLAHLNLSPQGSGLKIWDRPCPPNMLGCYGFRNAVTPPIHHITTIEPRTCTGITFWYRTHIDHLHAHTVSKPDPQETWRNYTYPSHNAMWFYLPLPPGEEILAFGVREPIVNDEDDYRPLSYVFWTALSGQITIGRHPYSETQDTVLATGPDLTLVHTRSLLHDNNFFGTHSAKRRQFKFDTYTPKTTPSFRRDFFSWAPLENITRVQVFIYNELKVSRKTCRGMIFHYADGSQRALGQCRLFKDIFVSHVNPSSICLAAVQVSTKNRTHEQTRVDFSCSEHRKEDDETEWRCFPMRGVLEFWYCHHEWTINVVVNGHTT
ncbi:hypothetical protein B0T10DRAFT_501671 [Thelonectria olida]|uniref:Uncharacterized protein n=1 Tax=Thelonectria olida TaxID=1576542 RepID=A0A9P8VQ98_9HYPO|nr:hypothetical protein B0T10DRAFT_501671 [Thelonectria olida]